MGYGISFLGPWELTENSSAVKGSVVGQSRHGILWFLPDDIIHNLPDTVHQKN